MRALFGLALPKCVERFSLPLLFYFLVSFVFVEILLEFPIFGDFEFLFFSCLLLDELSEVHQELHRSGVCSERSLGDL